VSIAPRRKPSMVIVLMFSAVLLMGAGLGGYFLRSKFAARPPAKVAPPEEAAIKPDLVEIPGGTFQMGRNDGPATEGPAHPATVATFFMDKTEVTNVEYGHFVRDTNHAPPEYWGGIKPPVGDERLPVANISYEDAVAFAAWRSKRDGDRKSVV